MSFQNLDLKAFANLLNTDSHSRGDSDDSDSEQKQLSLGAAGPGSIGPSKKGKGDDGAGERSEKRKLSEVAKTKEIWSPTEVIGDSTEASIPQAKDPRKTPTYNMIYRQSVSSEDLFLQIGNKTPSSASCENLVVEIELPGDDFNKIQLNLKEQAIDLRSPNHFLYLGLPHPIDPKAGNAKWDRDTEKLIVTLKLARELDGINF